MISAVSRVRWGAAWYSTVLYAAAVVMELCWLCAIMLFLNERATGGQLFIPGILLIYLLSFTFNMLVRRLAWPRIIITLINWLVWLIVMLITVKVQVFSEMGWINPDWIFSLLSSIPSSIYGVRPELLLLLISIAMWWPARWLAFRSMNFNTSIAEFQFGLLILILTYVITSVLSVEIHYSVAITVIFFFCGLIGISVAHTQVGKSWMSGMHKLQWMWLVIASIVLILVTGLIIAIVISPDLLRFIVDAANWIYTRILYLLSLLASLFPVDTSREVLPPVATIPSGEPDLKEFWKIPEEVRLWLNVVWAAIFLGFFAVALWQISSQIYSWMRRRYRASAAGVEPLKGAFKADVIAFFKRLIQQFIHWLSFLAIWKKKSISREEASVHLLYRRVLKWGAGLGYPRKEYQTPNEYLDIISPVLPPAGEDISFITEHFVRARYGRSVPTGAELQILDQSWKRIRQNRYRKQA